jgi:hypothetical protein
MQSTWTQSQLKADEKRLQNNLKVTNQYFINQVLGTILKNGKVTDFVCCETAEQGSPEKRLDVEYGIDFILMSAKGVQKYCMVRMTSFDNITIRKTTRGYSTSEFDKRLKQWETNKLDKDLILIHCVQTRDKSKTLHYYFINAYCLYNAVKENTIPYEIKTNGVDGNQFIAINPQDLGKANVPFRKVIL